MLSFYTKTIIIQMYRTKYETYSNLDGNETTTTIKETNKEQQQQQKNLQNTYKQRRIWETKSSEDHFKWRYFAENIWILFYGQPQSNNRI